MVRVLFVIGYLLLPFSSSPSSGGVITYGLPFLAVYAFIGLIIILQLSNWDYPFPVVWGGLFLLTMWVSIIFSSQNPLPSLTRLTPNLVGYLIFLTVFKFIENEIYTLHFFEKMVSISGAVLSGYYLINLFYMISINGLGQVIIERYTGGLSSLPWGASNNISSVLIISLVSAYICLKSDRRPFWIFSIVLISIGILSTLSRTGLVLLFLFYFGVLMKSAADRGKVMLIFLMVLLFSGGLIYTWQVVDRDSFDLLYSNRFSSANLFSGNSRWESWQEKAGYFINNPLLPIGYYSSLYVFNSFSAHNFFLTVLLEQGICGLVASLLFLFSPFWLYFKNKNNGKNIITKIYILGLTLILLNLSFEDANFTQPYILMFWLFMANLYNNILNSQKGW